MTNMDEQDLKDRLSLIENMIAEGRRTTASYGWTFVLWGVAYYVAIAWSTMSSFYLIWPITRVSASELMGVLVWLKRKNSGSSPVTTMRRAIWSIWIAMGISMFVLLDAIGYSGRLTDWRIYAAVAAALVGGANAASSLTLKWKLQFACAIVWWTAAVVSCFGTNRQSSIAFLAANFFCQIAFGIYLMIGEARARRQEATHA